jgi:uroporphyrinogen-III synthase
MLEVFISKDISELEALQKYCASRNWKLSASSLISFEAVPFTISKHFDLVFFTSPRSVMFFLRGHTIPPSCITACTGESTAALLRSLGFNPAFIGKGSDAFQIGLDFKTFLNDRRVLFPISGSSLRSISAQISPEQVEEVIVYNTLFKTKFLEKHDIYIFTSPSNYNSFREMNSIPAGALVIAWGTSTSKRLLQDGVQSRILKESSLDALLQELNLIE